MQDSAIEVAKSYNEIFDVTENFQEATCNGKEATCPASLPMADGTKCIDRGECRGGKCIPFCETQDLQVRSRVKQLIQWLLGLCTHYHTSVIIYK